MNSYQGNKIIQLLFNPHSANQVCKDYKELEVICATRYKQETRSTGTLMPSSLRTMIILLTSHSATSLVLHCFKRAQSLFALSCTTIDAV